MNDIKIAVSPCTWTKWDKKYPTEWKDEDYFVHVGATIDMVADPRPLVEYQKAANVGALMISGSAHEWGEDHNEDFNGPLGYPQFCDGWVVFRSTQKGKQIYEEFVKNDHKGITQILANHHLMPVMYGSQHVMIRTPKDEKPEIIWGKE